MTINSYVLSQEADDDLEEIFDYSFNKYGLDQAVLYLTNIENLFLNLVKNPKIGRVRNELKIGLFSFSIGEHIVFYRISDTFIRIVRVLYGGRDLPKFFGKEM